MSDEPKIIKVKLPLDAINQIQPTINALNTYINGVKTGMNVPATAVLNQQTMEFEYPDD